MKGTQGVIVAVGLGIAGALVNWFYLSAEAQKIAMVSFVGIRPGVMIGRGGIIKAADFVEVKIPANFVGNLRQFAYTWDARNTIKDRPTWREINSDTNGGTLLFVSDIQSPPAELELKDGDSAECVPIDPKLQVMSNIKPGYWVTFRVPTAPSLLMPTPALKPVTAPSPAPAKADGAAPAEDAPLEPVADKANEPPSGTFIPIGPFKVLSVGNRLGDASVMRSARIPQLQENILEIRVSKNEKGEPERFKKLWEAMQAAKFQGVGVTIHGINPPKM